MAKQTTITADDITRLVSDKLGPIMGEHARAQYVNAKMMDVPSSYIKAHMPATTDQTALAQAEQVARAAYKEDFSKLAAVGADKGHLPADLYSPDAIAAALKDTNGQADPSNLSFREHAARVLGTQPPTLNPRAQAEAAAAAQGVDVSRLTPQQRLTMYLETSAPQFKGLGGALSSLRSASSPPSARTFGGGAGGGTTAVERLGGHFSTSKQARGG
jgi:hypothetical protein